MENNMTGLPGLQAGHVPHAAGTATIRDARVEDFPEIQRIYAHHVLSSTTTFEIEPPSPEEMTAAGRRYGNTALPRLVAERDGRIVGYCYAALYRPRPAYRYTIEDSIYLADGETGKGIGSELLTALIEACERGHGGR